MQLATIAHLPLGLYDEIAIGKEAFADIFRRYGYTPEFAEQCREDKRFWVIVNDRRVELEKSGMVHVHRASAVADIALSELAKRVTDPHTPTPVILSIYQTTAKIAKLEPQQNVAVAQGSGFSISIHLNGASGRVEKVVESEPIEDLGETPEYVQKMVQELEYKE